MVFEKVAALISQQTKVPQSEIKMESKLLEDLKADSADVMMLILDLEQEFGVTVEDDVLMSIQTVGDIVNHLEQRAEK